VAEIKGAYFPRPVGQGTRDAGFKGLGIPRPVHSAGRHAGIPGNWKFYPVPLGPEYRYRMRAWNLNTSAYEFWTSEGAPDPNPPSGDPVQGVCVLSYYLEGS